MARSFLGAQARGFLQAQPCQRAAAHVGGKLAPQEVYNVFERWPALLKKRHFTVEKPAVNLVQNGGDDRA